MDEYREKRRARRERMIAEVYFVDEKNQSFGGCIAQDVSETGVRIKIEKFIPVGTFLNLEFKLPLSENSFFVKGKVMWINKSTQSDELWEAGLKVEPDTQYARLIQRYVTLKAEAARDKELE